MREIREQKAGIGMQQEIAMGHLQQQHERHLRAGNVPEREVEKDELARDARRVEVHQ